MFNHGLELEIPIKAVLVGENLQNFIDGMEETKGKYSIMVMHHSRMAPILALQKAGFLDVSGNLSQVRRLLRDKKYNDALTLLSMINKGFPDFHEVLYNMGFAYEQLFLGNPADESLREKALEFYKLEWEKNPNFDKAMRAIGILLAEKGQLEEAVAWLEKAYECAPASIPTLVALVETVFKKEQKTDPQACEIPEAVLKYLDEAYEIYPKHHKVIQLIDDFSKRFDIDLLSHFRKTPPSTLYQ